MFQDYHRFHFPVSGTIEQFVNIPGCLYTVCWNLSYKSLFELPFVSCLSSDFLTCFFFLFLLRSTPLLSIASIVMSSLRISELYQLFRLQISERFVSAIICLIQFVSWYMMIKLSDSSDVSSVNALCNSSYFDICIIAWNIKSSSIIFFIVWH